MLTSTQPPDLTNGDAIPGSELAASRGETAAVGNPPEAAQEPTTIVGVFEDKLDAQQAVAELRRAGFTEGEIGVAARDVNELLHEEEEQERPSRATEGAVTGTLTGASIGGLWALGIAAGMLPAIGPAIAGGMAASLLASAATGAAAGTFLGSLVGVGIPEPEAREWEAEFNAGRIIITVRSHGRHHDAAIIMREYGGRLRTALGQLE